MIQATSEEGYLTKEFVLSRINELDIFQRYIGGDIKLSTMYISPFNPTEQVPSFNIFYSSKFRCLYFKDLGGSGKHGDCIQFVMYITNKSYNDAIKDILSKFAIDTSKAVEELFIKQHNSRKPITIIPITQPFSQFDLDYWNQYGITKEVLRKLQVKSLKSVWVGSKLYLYKEVNPIFGIRCNNRFKIYFPFESKVNKWKSNLIRTDYIGYNILPKNGEVVFITKGVKDVGTLATLSFPAIGTLSENVFPTGKFVRHLKERFERVIVLYDNDKSGIDAANRLCNEQDLEYIHFPIGEPKDTSDFYKEYGESKTINVINNLLYV